MRWADLYRQTKIQETVYELLRQQYELAKIQEAKEIPTVKMLDMAGVPERKSSPNRLAIIALGGFFVLCSGISWILGREAWEWLDPEDPKKAIALEIRKISRARLNRAKALLHKV